jgi:tetratricopeptide (TPR) repeat protein
MPDQKRRTIRDHTPWAENPSEEWAYALAHMEAEDWDNAIKHSERAIEIWPTYYDAWLLLACAFEEQGDYDKALQAVERASEIAIGELSEAWNNMASLYLLRSEWEQEIAVDRILDLIDPTRHAIIRYRMAISYTQLGDLETGFKWLREAIEFRPGLLSRALTEPWLSPLHERLQKLGEEA